ncbi:MAG: undecaprenyl/decaprenyl-phosphate alpha-N-acetylglucosaminyl 1-phosphate transferase [Proteobacteria bacterium]|nr:undecaprenyl/decaprenyl-phosphate alpha-N-acetylglucosaminyl 1-phosphate transferase [Pseudomonadota bacterium]
MSEIANTTIFGVSLAFTVTLALAGLLAPAASRLRLVDTPKGRKAHAAPTPVVGGLAMFVGATVGLLPAILMLGLVPANLVGLGLAGVVVMVAGVLDDMYDLRWYVRLLAQVVAALSMVYVGDVRVEHVGALFGLEDLALGPISLPLTVFATVGLINALNMVDGVDGLAGSLSAAALLMLLVAALYSGNVLLASGLAVAISAVCAFLVLNMRWPWQKRARVFMGNSGSALLGLIIAWATFRLTQSPEHPVSPILAPFFVAIPLLDCVTLIARRLGARRSPFHADREHVHHLLLDAGLAPSTIVILLTCVSLLLGLAASAALRMGAPEPALVLVFAVVAAGYAWFTGSRRRVNAVFGPVGSFRPSEFAPQAA